MIVLLVLDVAVGLLDENSFAESLLVVVPILKAVEQFTVAQNCWFVGLASDVHVLGPAHSMVLVAVSCSGVVPNSKVHCCPQY